MQKWHAVPLNVKKNDYVYIWDHLQVIQNGIVGVESDEGNYHNTCLCMKMCVWECVIKFTYVNLSRLSSNNAEIHTTAASTLLRVCGRVLVRQSEGSVKALTVLQPSLALRTTQSVPLCSAFREQSQFCVALCELYQEEISSNLKSHGTGGGASSCETLFIPWNGDESHNVFKWMHVVKELLVYGV